MKIRHGQGRRGLCGGPWRVRLLSLWVLVGAGILLGWPMAALAQGPLAERIRGILNRGTNAKADFSLHVVELDSGQLVYAHNPDLALKPASNMKLVTTATALKVLGKDFTYETVVGLLGSDLVVVAGGDPLVGDPRLAERRGEGIDAIFQQVRDALAGRKISEIAGDLVIDDFIFDDERFHSSWPVEQANRWYAAQVSALCFNDNCVDVTVRPNGGAGSPAGWSVTPETRYVRIENECKTIGSGKNGAWAARVLGGNELTLKGSVRTEHTFAVTVERPSAFFGQVLAEYLLKRGIAIRGKLIIRRVRDDTGRLPGELESLVVWRTPLVDVLERANQDSLNLAAECLFKTIGAYGNLADGQVCGQGSWSSGRAVVRAHLVGLGLSVSEFVVDDGCGLSHENRLSARCLTTVIRSAALSEAGATYRESLATPREGTLARARRLGDSEFEGRVQAKTGYVNGAWALSGLCRRGDHTWLAFSFLANGVGCGSQSGTLDEILGVIME